jgi:uncharacterized protein (DUF2336 family)
MHSETVTVLQKLAKDRSPEGRGRLADQIVNFYITEGNQPGFLTSLEKDLLFDIVMKLVNSAKEEIKKTLAENLAHEEHVPKELILTLANEDISIADPLLANNNLLNDQDLVGVIHSKGPLHQFSIAGRESISEEVTDALIQAGDPATMTKLFQNQGAKISEKGMEMGSEHCKTMLELQEPYLHRDEITEDFAAKIYHFASESIKSEIMEKFEITQEMLDKALSNALKIKEENIKKQSPLTPEQIEMGKKLYDSGSLNSAVLISVLRRGEYQLFKYLFSLMTKLQEDQVIQVTEEFSEMVLASALKAIGISDQDFTTIYLLIDSFQTHSQNTDQARIRKIMDIYKNLDILATRNLLKKWREDPESLVNITFD